MADRRDFFENLVYQTVDRRRFTQQSPVMPDVWIHYGMNPGEQQHLLMVPDWHYTPAALTGGIKERLSGDRDNARLRRFRLVPRNPEPAAVAHNQSAVVATLWFDQLIRAVLPLSGWWRDAIAGTRSRRDRDRLHLALENKGALVTSLVTAWGGDDARKGAGPARRGGARSAGGEHDDAGGRLAGGLPLSADVLWLTRVAGLLAFIATKAQRDRFGKLRSENSKVELLQGLLEKKNHRKLAGALVDILTESAPAYPGDNYPLYSVNRNRETSTSLRDSVAAVKADASNRVFQVRGEGIRWAVIDSGVDARHVAFRRRNADGVPRRQPFSRPRRRRRAAAGSTPGAEGFFVNDTRVVATYDFVHIRELLGTEPEEVDALPEERFPALALPGMRQKLRELIEDYHTGVIDWQRLQPFLEIRHTPKAYRPPVDRHGTHVAGIIGADWRTSDEEVDLPGPRREMTGMCPEIELYDLRVLGDDGTGNEFAIMSAMQFVRALNTEKDFMAVHGVNLSLSIPHDVANYACGRTPVCEEAERLVGNGILTVAAAGNSGRARYLTPSNEIDDGFRTVSITDPGNAESVVTVGATHRRDPHTYGVSYFSSRGPTGDGRLKPDLVAPGEKIRSTVPDDRDDRLDGTSMAAPHVSGAAALIMTRHREVIGQPGKIKEILCRSATDLGREPYFQGAGMLDILRALQEI